jgi:hypothetical protein
MVRSKRKTFEPFFVKVWISARQSLGIGQASFAYGKDYIAGFIGSAS